MKLYLAGSESEKYDNVLLECGATKRLASYFYIKHTPSERFDLLIDSGGFTARKTGVPISVKAYSDFLNKLKIKKAFNLDTNSVEESLENQIYLENKCPDAYIIPIYHYNEFNNIKHRELIYKYIEKYPYIGLGGLAMSIVSKDCRENFFNFVFNLTKDKIKVHGLGITGKEVISKYPFYSVDSTSWLKTARFGGMDYYKDNKKMSAYMAKNVHYFDRLRYDIKIWLDLEKQVTELWKARGIVWKD